MGLDLIPDVTHLPQCCPYCSTAACWGVFVNKLLFHFAEVCSVDCGTHGVCMSGACRCEDGWTGIACDQRVCNPRCVEHGTCKEGKCECREGWNGEHCTIGRQTPSSKSGTYYFILTTNFNRDLKGQSILPMPLVANVCSKALCRELSLKLNLPPSFFVTWFSLPFACTSERSMRYSKHTFLF